MNSFVPASEAPRAFKCDLAAQVLRSSGSLRLRATGRSMLPSIWPSDTLVIEPVEMCAISEGEIVVFRRAHQFFAHRVVSKIDAGETLLTRGDAMPQPDPPVLIKDLLGKIVFIVRDGRLIEASRNLSFPQRAVASVMRRSEIGARVVVGVHGMLQAALRQNSHDRAVSCQS